jgi:HNH endonuclease
VSNFDGVIALLLSPLAVLVAIGGPPMLVPREWRATWRNRRRGWLIFRGPSRSEQHSSRISLRLRRKVLAAGRYRCLYCGSQSRLDIDHIIPWAWGGLTRFWNLAVLCDEHNLVKRDWWADRHGRVHGHSSRPDIAAEIYAREKSQRISLFRWARSLSSD